MSAPLVVDGPDRVAAALSGLSVALMAVPAAGVGDPRMFGPVSWWWPLLFAAALAALHAQVPWRRRSRGAAAVVVAFWSAAGAWVAWGYGHGLGHGGYWLTWAAGLVLTVVAAATWATPTDLGLPMRPYAQHIAAYAPAAPAVDEWADRVAQVTRQKILGARTLSVEAWDSSCGYTAHLALPADGCTWQTLQPYEAGLAAALGLPAGGGVTVGPDGDHGLCRVDVLTVDAMAEPVPYPGLD
jgi:hypothetical protein